MTDSRMTKDHQTIRAWAEARRAEPAHVAATGANDDPGILRLDFEPRDRSLEPISWDEFFRKFDEADLSFLYQDKTEDGHTSRFHKFVHGQAREHQSGA